jgi:hypothetical protein
MFLGAGGLFGQSGLPLNSPPKLGRLGRPRIEKQCCFTAEIEVSLANGVVIRVRADNQGSLFILRPVRKDEILVIYDGPIINHPTRYSIQIDDKRLSPARLNRMRT